MTQVVQDARTFVKDDKDQAPKPRVEVVAQYRSAIFSHDAEQETAARASKEKLQGSGRFKGEIVTEITPASTFHRAEEYHQQYLEKRRRAGRLAQPDPRPRSTGPWIGLGKP